MVTAIYLASMSSMVYLVRSQISLPFSGNRVTGIAFDGQPLDLYLDSGLIGTHVIYKDWYEKTYGICPPKTCYTCINECHPYSEEQLMINFDDGSAITTVYHYGVIELAGHKLEMKFRLIVGWSPSPTIPTEKPMNYLGIAYRMDRYDETVMIQLFLKNLISDKTVSVCAPSDLKNFTGVVILGSLREEQCPTAFPKIVLRMKSSGFFNTALLSLALVSSKGRPFMQRVPDGMVIYDTGAYSVFLPKPYFEFVLNKITEIVKQDSGLDVHVVTKGSAWFIEERGYEYFPTLAFALGDRTSHTTIYIPPSQYTENCGGTWCHLVLRHYNLPYITLGRPFFTTYFSSFREIREGRRTVTLAPYAKSEG
ncbi:hypothetical protein FOL47_003771 [Perkinsus chesapeaki]|uniref:Peptidase A1 domain-containing protein n=1 Tax=Perkinsus chesapeaki TaxID=330153 RepID=A0A7J6MZI1_PERCH|nr:hypothetical protein FOL47_003771 [Perkinsus chesapeaki]